MTIVRHARRAGVALAVAGTMVALTGAPASADRPGAPSPNAACVATITVAETTIAPGFVGDEVRRIVALGHDVLPTTVRALTTAHSGDLESCAALVGE
jgi:hypothetical protein